MARQDCQEIRSRTHRFGRCAVANAHPKRPPQTSPQECPHEALSYATFRGLWLRILRIIGKPSTASLMGGFRSSRGRDPNAPRLLVPQTVELVAQVAHVRG